MAGSSPRLRRRLCPVDAARTGRAVGGKENPQRLVDIAGDLVAARWPADAEQQPLQDTRVAEIEEMERRQLRVLDGEPTGGDLLAEIASQAIGTLLWPGLEEDLARARKFLRS